MRQKCTTILKVSVALILALMMVVGSISTVVAATITIEQSESTTDSTAADNKAADVADDSADAPAQSVPLTDKLVRLVKDDIAGTGAAVDVAPTGYDHWYVKGNWDMNGEEWVLHDISGTGYEVTLNGGTDYSFVFVANRDQFTATNCVITRTTDYNFSNKNKEENMTLRTTIAGKYKFIYKSMSGGDTSMSVRIEFPEDTTPDTWTVVGGSAGNTNGGQSDPLFTSTWDTTLNQNDMTNTSGTTWTWTKNNVTLNAGKILCKVVKNHTWDTAYPASGNQESAASLAAGTYNVTITFNFSTKDVTIAATQITKSTLTVQDNIDNATVKATYNGTTVNEGGHIDNIPAGAQVTINVTPAQGKKCTAVTGTYSGGTASATSDGTGKVWTMTMPAENTEVSATIGDVSLKKIYFNNNYTLYGTVYAYVYDKVGSTETNLYLGKKPGKVMIESENSEIWYIEVPETITYVQFISGEGYTTGEMTIPWKSGNTGFDYPKYTAPYGHNDAPNTTNGGTWGNYLYGSDNKRTNEYTVSDGPTMSAPNLFTGITATLYDYYTNGEIAASAGTDSDTGSSGAPNGWLKGIASNEYDPGTSGNLWLPYEDLNGALIGYADTTSQPKYDVTYPLYFGNLNYATKSGYYNYSQKANNSVPLTYSSNAVTGLSGKTLANGSIHYYDADDTTNENGAPMAMFNEDFLSGENSVGKPLATILRTSSFPVRTTTSAAGYHKIYFDASSVSWWNNSNVTTKAHFWDSNHTDDTLDVVMTQDQTKKFIYSTDRVDSKYDKVIFYRGSWNNQTYDLDVPLVTDTNLCYQLNGQFHGDNNKYCYGSWTKNSDAVYYNASHVYYEFDSTNGKDNAYITDINKSDKTAKINYYYDSNKTKTGAGAGDPYGFFPFDYNTYQDNANNSSNIAHDLGFGMKLEIPFTLEANGKFSNNDPQEFNFSGDDDLWVFVDGKLVLDLGGAHGRTTGTINFNTKKITYTMTESIGNATRNDDFTWFDNTNPNYVHTMTIYYMERGMFDSNLKFGFSFHAIPNQFWIDKKIRTKDRYGTGEYDTINSGFFTNNGLSDDASNMTTHTLGEKTTAMTKFEKSFQDEEFLVTHWYGSNGATPTTLATGKHYTIDYDTTTYETGNDGKYPIYHDKGNAFIGEFTTGDKFKLIETPDNNNKYVYKPKFSVWDQANNDKEIPAEGDNTNGYTFDFTPTTQVTGGIENTNIKARFENFMVAHDLTLTKELTNTTDATTTFTFQILFDFTGTAQSPNYVSYPLFCDVDGVRTKLTDDGTITIKAGQTVDIFEIPEKAKVQVTEVLTDTVSGYRYADVAIKKGATTLASGTDYTPVTKGAQFLMGDGDMNVTFSNKKPDNKYTITYFYDSYDNLYGQQSYTVTGVFKESELETYMELTNDGLRFKSDKLKKTFVNSKAPYEDNFHQTLSFADSTIVDSDAVGLGWDANGNYTCTVTANPVTNNDVSVYFKLPYTVDASLSAVEDAETKRIEDLGDAIAVGSKRIECFDWYVTGGKSRYDKPGDTPVFVKAPLIIYEVVNGEPTPQYFQYWSVIKQSGYGMDSTEYTRCYDYEFNLSLFMDCYIEPVYVSYDAWYQNTGGNPNPPQAYNSYDRFDPDLQISGDAHDKEISVTFLENSRNQYNNNGGGSRDKGAAADVIYSDFLLTFNNYNGEPLNTLDADTKKAGLVIESVGYMAGSNAAGFDSSKDYSDDDKYTGNVATKKVDIETWLTTGSKPEGLSADKSEFDVRSLDNKNCIQYYYAFNNRKLDAASGQLLNTTQNRYKVFRAYAYIGDVKEGGGLNNVQISDPIYFTIYDIGKLYDLADNANLS